MATRSAGPKDGEDASLEEQVTFKMSRRMRHKVREHGSLVAPGTSEGWALRDLLERGLNAQETKELHRRMRRP